MPIGKIVGTFGLKGALKVWPETSFPERFDAGKTIVIDEVAYVIRESAWHKKQVRIRLEGITRIEEAEKFVGKQLAALSSEAPDLEEDEYAVEDLLGMTVIADDGRVLGQIDEVMHAPAHDVYRVGQILIPAVKAFIIRVDVASRSMTVHLIPGMEPTDG